MTTDFDTFTNRGEYLSGHYFTEQLGTDLKKGLLATWSLREADGRDPRATPRERVRALRADYLSEEVRSYFAGRAEREGEDGGGAGRHTYQNEEWRKRLGAWHQRVLHALGYEDGGAGELVVHRAGHEHTVHTAYHGHGIIALDCGWAAEHDVALDPGGAGRLLTPLRVNAGETYETGAALASWLFQSELHEPGGHHPRFILLLHGGVLLLADRNAWAEGRYLAVSLDAALERNDRKQLGELATLAALFSQEMLRPGDNEQSPGIDALLKASSNNAVGVTNELRYALQVSVEIIANEVLDRLAETGLTPAEIEDPKTPIARQLTRETLRYLYRVLFLLYAEARPELGVLPADDGSYEAGYSMARLRELVARDEQLVEEEARNGFHLFESLDVLFTKVNDGHRRYGTDAMDDQPGDDEETRGFKAARRSEDRGLRFEPLRSELFEPAAIRLIGKHTLDPRCDEDSTPQRLDLRLRNAALHEVLRRLTMKKASRRGERGGFISYRNLGINQLGAVYEGLMSYTGFIADEELCEVAKGGDPEKGSWMVPSHRQREYPDSVIVRYDQEDARKGLRGPKKYAPGAFVYRLSGRDRESSASYYTPTSLTELTVELALKNRLDQERDEDGNVIRTRASELLTYKICEPALGSGAFLNEAINQVADEYLRRRQEELGITIPTSAQLTEKQKVKAYVALHNAYGVDLNETGVELAEVSLWLNTMHPGMQAPWFGLHLRRGNSLIGGRRAVYDAEDVVSTEKAWLKDKGTLAPRPLPFLRDGTPQTLPEGAIHQFLLPTPGWAAVTKAKEAKELLAVEVAQLGRWRRGILQRPKRSTSHLNKDGTAKLNPKTKQPKPEARSQFTRLRDVARRAEFLWTLVTARMRLSERDIARRIDVWQADPSDPEFSFLQHPEHAVQKEKIYEDLFNAVDTPYWRLKTVMDAWCALWFWPADQVGLLDGTDGAYAEEAEEGDITTTDLGSLLGMTGPPAASVPRQRPAPDEPSASPAEPASQSAPEPRFAEQAAFFAMGDEQLALSELELTADDDHVVETTKVPAPRPAPDSQGKPSKPAQSKQQKRRKHVPLRNFEDWLEFLEAMLGKVDVPDGSLIDQFEGLEDLKEYEQQLPGFMQMDTEEPEQRFPWLHTVRKISEAEGFLHWELDFALVFAQNGGFDLQMGNPPWVRPRWDEPAVLAEYEPWFALEQKESAAEKAKRRHELLEEPAPRRYWLNELTTNSAHVALLSSPQTYPLLTGTQPDLYRAFMCQTWDHRNADGIVGLLHPDTHFSGDREGNLREAAYRRLRVHGDFVNSANRFFPAPVGHNVHFGVHIYGQAGEVGFDHLSWLASTDTLRLSINDHDASGGRPGVKHNGAWDMRPHRSRVIRVNQEVLMQWQRLTGDPNQRSDQARLLSPVSTAEASAIQAFVNYPSRLSALTPQISPGYHESGAKSSGLIDYNVFTTPSGQKYQPDRWHKVILKGTQFSIATPIFKQHDASSTDPYGRDLVSLSTDYVTDTAYVRASGKTREYLAAQDRWIDYRVLARLRTDKKAVARARAQVAKSEGVTEEKASSEKIDAVLKERARRRYTVFPRLAWRCMIAPNTERALYPALIPPGPAHINAVNSLAMPELRLTALVAGFWSSLPLDYFLRITGRTNLQVAAAKSMPAPTPQHPLASALLLRTLRLNCLTRAYADMWAELYEPAWLDGERWVCDWPGLQSLHGVGPEWCAETPLRSERARRSALVELDALVAVWLGMDADALLAAYRGRFPVLQKYEAVTWFDAEGWKLAGNARTFGQRQTKESFGQLQAYLADPDNAPPPAGYAPDFHKADREREMREAHAVFQARLDAAVARGQWDPVRQQEVPES